MENYQKIEKIGEGKHIEFACPAPPINVQTYKYEEHAKYVC